MKVAITGATGFLGRFIVGRLIEEGVDVRAWRRASSDLAGLHAAAARWIEGGLGRPESFEPLVSGTDVLVHAALDHLPGRYRGGEGVDPARFLSINVGGSLALLAAARAAGVSRCVVLSSRAVFDGRTAPGPIGDEEPVRPRTIYGAAKAALEVFVESWGLGEGFPIAALRPTGIYGLTVPVERSKWYSLVGDALRGDPVPPRSGSEVHGSDVADAVWRLIRAEPEKIAGRMFNCSDIVVSNRDLVERAHGIAGISGPLPDRSPAPRNLMACGGLAELGVRFGGWPLLDQTVEALVLAHRDRTEVHGARTPGWSRRDCSADLDWE